jgi:hypothetical protein
MRHIASALGDPPRSDDRDSRCRKQRLVPTEKQNGRRVGKVMEGFRVHRVPPRTDGHPKTCRLLQSGIDTIREGWIPSSSGEPSSTDLVEDTRRCRQGTAAGPELFYKPKDRA